MRQRQILLEPKLFSIIEDKCPFWEYFNIKPSSDYEGYSIQQQVNIDSRIWISGKEVRDTVLADYFNYKANKN